MEKAEACQVWVVGTTESVGQKRWSPNLHTRVSNPSSAWGGAFLREKSLGKLEMTWMFIWGQQNKQMNSKDKLKDANIKPVKRVF